MTIHKSAPREIQVGKPAVFRVTVRNTGLTAAAQVEIRDRVPRGTRLLGTSPQAKRDANGELAWTLGTIRSGEEAFVEMQVMPLTEGEIGSVATVHFGADASVRTVATRPQLAVETSAPGQVLIGEQVMLTITVSNPGTGVATNVVLAERIPRGLQHPAGGELEYTVGNLKPGESRRLDLPLMAKRPGPVTNRLVARADGNLRAVAERRVGSARAAIEHRHGRVEEAVPGAAGDLPGVGGQLWHGPGPAGRIGRPAAAGPEVP